MNEYTVTSWVLFGLIGVLLHDLPKKRFYAFLLVLVALSVVLRMDVMERYKEQHTCVRKEAP